MWSLSACLWLASWSLNVGFPVPPAELIPFIFGIVNRAILVVRTICHLRSERISFAVVLTENRTRDLSQAETGRYQVPPCAGHGNSEPGGQPLCCHCAFCADVPLLEVAKRRRWSSVAHTKPSIPLGKGIAGFSVHGLVLCGLLRLSAFLPFPPALGEQVVATVLLTRCLLTQSLLLLADQLWDFWLLPDLSTGGLQCAFAVATGRGTRRLVPKTGQGLH